MASGDSKSEVQQMKTGGRHDSNLEISLRVGSVNLQGIFSVPSHPCGVVLFAHGSGSGRLSPRNTFVGQELQAGGLATLLIDLLDPQEAQDRRKVFNIDLLADRLLLAQEWLTQQAAVAKLGIGYFGASTGAGAALQAAARSSFPVAAVVSRGGRPDLAKLFLPSVTAPTLLIVGGVDHQVIDYNREALEMLTCRPKDMVIITGASHLFEEPGTLEQVSRHALDWFRRFFLPPDKASAKARV
jgi:putative phosphoribosyl transferase